MEKSYSSRVRDHEKVEEWNQKLFESSSEGCRQVSLPRSAFADISVVGATMINNPGLRRYVNLHHSRRMKIQGLGRLYDRCKEPIQACSISVNAPVLNGNLDEPQSWLKHQFKLAVVTLGLKLTVFAMSSLQYLVEHSNSRRRHPQQSWSPAQGHFWGYLSTSFYWRSTRRGREESRDIWAF